MLYVHKSNTIIISVCFCLLVFHDETQGHVLFPRQDRILFVYHKLTMRDVFLSQEESV